MKPERAGLLEGHETGDGVGARLEARSGLGG